MFFGCDFSEEALKKSKKRLYMTGSIMLAIGIISLLMPMLASFAVETLTGMLLLSVGLCSAYAAYSAFKIKDNPWQEIFMSVISFAAGFIFIAHPLAGIMTLSFLLSIWFLLDGIVKVYEYFRMRSIGGSLWVLVSGILGVILAFMMWNNIFTGAAMVGVILGINLTFGGLSLIMLGRGCSSMLKR